MRGAHEARRSRPVVTSPLHCLLRALAIAIAVGVWTVPGWAGTDWLPIPKEDLEMKEFTPIPGTHAVVLYRKQERDDYEGWLKEYVRIKILDEEGKAAANVETTAYNDSMRLTDLQARTIEPDGNIVQFQGQAADKLLAKYKGEKLTQKTFALPDVRVGSIIEYRYTIKWSADVVYDSEWQVAEYVPTRQVDFSLRPAKIPGYGLTWMYYLIPAEDQPKINNGLITSTMHNIPGMEKEDYMPPDSVVRARVEFVYRTYNPTNPDEYWKTEATGWTKRTNDYLGKKKQVESEVGTITQGATSPEEKLQKIYTRVQAMRNLSYERERSEKEEQKEKLKPNSNVDDALKHGYGWDNELTRVFVALARAAGFDATIIRVTDRDYYFHNKALPNFRWYTDELALVTVNGKELFLSPGTPFCPYGLVPWEDAGSYGLVLNKDNAVWKQTPEPLPNEAVRRRIADLELDADGDVKGDLSATFESRDALQLRLAERDHDDAQRRKDLEERIKDWLPTGATVKLKKVDDWNVASQQFVVTAEVTIPGIATATGKRLMVPVSIFTGSDDHPFKHMKRVNPIYFRNPYQNFDVVTVKVPEGLQVESIPQAKTVPTAFAGFVQTVSKEANAFKVDRQMAMKEYIFPTKDYSDLRQFFDTMKSAGSEQVVLRAASK